MALNADMMDFTYDSSNLSRRRKRSEESLIELERGLKRVRAEDWVGSLDFTILNISDDTMVDKSHNVDNQADVENMLPADTKQIVDESDESKSPELIDTDLIIVQDQSEEDYDTDSTGTTVSTTECTIVPVFCIAEIPKSILYWFILKAKPIKYDYEHYTPRIISVKDIESPEMIPRDGASKADMIEEFVSPFVDKSMDEINEIRRNLTSLSKRFTQKTCIVLDRQSTQDYTCLLLADDGDLNLDDGECWRRVLLNFPEDILYSVEADGACIRDEFRDGFYEYELYRENRSVFTQIVPVFVLADIPLDILNRFLTAVSVAKDAWSWAPLLISAEDRKIMECENKSLHTWTRGPLNGFASGFQGKTLAEANEFFAYGFESVDWFIDYAMIILDEQSIKDESCLILIYDEQFDMEIKERWLRTDFFLAMSFVVKYELNLADLGEGLSRDTVWGIDNINLSSCNDIRADPEL